MAGGTVGLVGIGMMGWPMGANILKAGLDLVVYDAAPGRVEQFCADVGGRAAPSLAALGREAPIVITMLPNSRVVTDVVLGEPDPLAAAMKEGSTLIEMSSGAPEATIAIGRRLAERGVRVIDAPVSGGVPRATSGELTIMAGGDPAVIEACRPLLETMGRVTEVGILGAGQAMKALNNLVSAGGFLIGIEALLIGQKFGLSPDRMVDILNSSSGMNSSTQRKFKQYVLSRRFSDGGFGIGLMAKDVGIALDVAKSNGVSVPFSALCAQLWAAASSLLGPSEDHTAITRMCEQFAGVTLGEAPRGET